MREIGSAGKSALTKHLSVYYKAYVTGEEARYKVLARRQHAFAHYHGGSMITNFGFGSMQDIAEGFKPVDEHSNVALFHHSRANASCANYSAMESFKDGILFSSK